MGAPDKQETISQQWLRSNMISLWTNNSLITDAKYKLRVFKTEYTYSNNDYGAAMFFVIVEMVRSDTCTGWSNINTNLESMKKSHSKHDIPKANLQIVKWMNEISISGETYTKIVRNKLNLYYTSSCPLYRD